MKMLNKKNLLKFADYLYTEKNGFVYYRPLCVGEYTGGVARKEGNTVKYCILGELYEFFIGTSPYIDFKYDWGWDIKTTVTEDDIVKKLLFKANLRPLITTDYLSCLSLEDIVELELSILERAINNLVDLNDGNGLAFEEESEEEYIARAKKCSDACKQIANTLLI